MLHRLFEGELHVQTLIDRVVLASFRSFAVLTSCIVTTVESVLDAVAEEEEGILQERVGNQEKEQKLSTKIRKRHISNVKIVKVIIVKMRFGTRIWTQ